MSLYVNPKDIASLMYDTNTIHDWLTISVLLLLYQHPLIIQLDPAVCSLARVCSINSLYFVFRLPNRCACIRFGRLA